MLNLILGFLLSILLSPSDAFTVSQLSLSNLKLGKKHTIRNGSSSSGDSLPYFMEELYEKKPIERNNHNRRSKNNAQNIPSHKKGIFSPTVLAAKKLLGEETLNQVRGKVIGIHSDVISAFVSTHESIIGNVVLEQLFAIIDKNKYGVIDTA
jgi:hypothetical protein